MGRWEPNARGRLVNAALELYSERGFDRTTAAEIAQRAGLTERTFFRYFADKREVLFWGQDRMQELIVKAIAGAPEAAAPIDAVGLALRAVGVELQENRERVLQRQAVIAANADLQERELTKLAALASAIAEALRPRGVGDLAAKLTGEASVAVFKIAFESWINDPRERGFPQLIGESFDELKAVTAASTAAAPR